MEKARIYRTIGGRRRHVATIQKGKARLQEEVMGAFRTLANMEDDVRAVVILNNILDEFHQLIKKERPAMRKTYKIELKINFDDDERHKIALKLMRKMARTILTQASMIADNNERPPQVSFQTEDLFEGTDDLALQEEEQDEAQG